MEERPKDVTPGPSQDQSSELDALRKQLLEVQAQLEQSAKKQADIQLDLDIAKKELDKRVGQSTPFINMKKMLMQKNQLIKQLRESLNEYEPQTALSEEDKDDWPASFLLFPPTTAMETSSDSNKKRKLVDNNNASNNNGESNDHKETKEEDEDIVETSGPRKKLTQRKDCPYLDTVKRHLLDFDFEKLCSVTLQNFNVYACLVCGKYFQGRLKINLMQ